MQEWPMEPCVQRFGSTFAIIVIPFGLDFLRPLHVALE
jgi:hypothetical protein